MNYDDIKKLMDDMGNSKLTDVSIEFPDGIKISMKKDYKNIKLSEERCIVEHVTEDNQESNMIEKEIKSCKDEKVVKSPMVGTFYSKPSPDAEAYVHIGQNVKKGDVLCVIEAMKLINEIECEFDGKIEEILVEDGEIVDFGKPLFKIV